MTGIPLWVTTCIPVGSDGNVAVGRSSSVRVVVVPLSVIATKLYLEPKLVAGMRDCWGCVVVIIEIPLTVVTKATPIAVEVPVSATKVIDAGQTLELEVNRPVIVEDD